jgi:hypothetical protein
MTSGSQLHVYHCFIITLRNASAADTFSRCAVPKRWYTFGRFPCAFNFMAIAARELHTYFIFEQFTFISKARMGTIETKEHHIV